MHVSMLTSAAELRRSILPLQRLLVARNIALRPGEDATQYHLRRVAFDTTRERVLVDVGRTLLPQLPRNIRHLYIVADGPLSSLPWNALRTPCGARQLCYAIERYAIASEPSASVAVQLKRHPVRTAEQNVLIVADPITQPGQPALRWASLAPLPGSRREANAIARLIPAESLQIIRGEMATVDNVLALSKNLSILHFATHTFLVPGHPELSGIALSPERGKSEGKSILWLHDIPALQAPSLVVLNGCSTQGQGLGGEELSALTQAFFYAGSHEVIGTIWSVDDEVAATLMEHFYRELISRHMKAVDALRSAQLGMLKNGANLSDWAGFVIDGVPARTVDAQMTGRR
jgi:CHAT domain-containing protein